MLKNKKLPIILLGITIGFIIWLTLFCRVPGARRNYISILWSYRAWLSGSVVAGYQIIGNILLFVPFGLLVSMSGIIQRENQWKTIVYGFIFSLMIEVTQLVLRLGSFELDDLLNNTLGATIGYGAYKLLCLIWSQRRMKKMS